MSDPSTKACDRCHGVVHATRRVSLTVALANHEASCPGGTRPKKS